MDAFSGTFVVKSALLLAPLLFVRPGELRKALWADVDLDKAEWRYFVTKTKTEHSVPLATQAVAILQDLHALTGHGANVFPGGGVDAEDGMAEIAAMSPGLDDAQASCMLGIESGGLAFWVGAVRECFEEAGLLMYDVITEINGVRVTTYEAMTAEEAAKAPAKKTRGARK